MIALSQTPRIEAKLSGGGSQEWALYLSVGAPFDFNIPFRSILQMVVTRLSMSADCTLQLPPYQQGEDFVSGSMDWGASTIGIYYEHSLGYLSFSSCDRTVVERVLSELSNIN